MDILVYIMDLKSRISVIKITCFENDTGKQLMSRTVTLQNSI